MTDRFSHMDAPGLHTYWFERPDGDIVSISDPAGPEDVEFPMGWKLLPAEDGVRRWDEQQRAHADAFERAVEQVQVEERARNEKRMGVLRQLAGLLGDDVDVDALADALGVPVPGTALLSVHPTPMQDTVHYEGIVSS